MGKDSTIFFKNTLKWKQYRLSFSIKGAQFIIIKQFYITFNYNP